MKRVILSTTKQNDIILDPFFGTGTTGAVAKKLKRNFIGIEREAKYVKVAAHRIENIKEFMKEADEVEIKKQTKAKVPFESLVKNGILKAGNILYSKGRYNKQAEILENGNLKCDNNIGSIHKIGALIQQSASCNGWMFWYVKKDNRVFLLDNLRSEYLLRV